jgi:hypothetical protein
VRLLYPSRSVAGRDATLGHFGNPAKFVSVTQFVRGSTFTYVQILSVWCVCVYNPHTNIRGHNMRCRDGASDFQLILGHVERQKCFNDKSDSQVNND